MKTLEQQAPIEFSSDFPSWKYRNVTVEMEHDSRDKAWPGKHKNVTYWWELSNGYAVGLNENPSTGISFPFVRL